MIILKNKAQVEGHHSILKSLVEDQCGSGGYECRQCIMNKQNSALSCLRITIRKYMSIHMLSSDIQFHKNYEVFYNILNLIDVKCEYKICDGCPYMINKKCILPILKQELNKKYVGDNYDSR